MEQETSNYNLDVAIVHDWLPVLGGAEKVVEQFTKIYPKNEIYTLFNFLNAEDEEIFGGSKINVSKMNSWPWVEKYYRNLFLLCTKQIEQFDVSKHDIVISSSAALAKGVLTRVEQPHICYMHSPARYAWDMSHEYVGDIQGRFRALKAEIAKEMIYRFRYWDQRSINTVDDIVANSKFIQKRIFKVYKRKSEVIYPPVDIDKFSLYAGERDDYYVTASRLVPYKKIDLIVKAFTELKDKKLVVIGSGPELQALKKMAGKNITFLGYQSQEDMIYLIQRAKAFVFAAFEDFGIVPVEAQACGTPVICYSKGGTSETVIPISNKNPTGVWFNEQNENDIVRAVKEFENNIDKFDPMACRINAEFFGDLRFRDQISKFVNNILTTRM